MDTRVSSEGCGQAISVAAIGPKARLPESLFEALACQVALPRLQSMRNAARPSVPKSTVNVAGSGTVVLPCLSSIDSRLTSRQLVPSSGCRGVVDPQAASAGMRATAAVGRSRIRRMGSNLRPADSADPHSAILTR